MIQIGNAIVSFDVFDYFFACDISSCKGDCCVEGDSGAPLTKEEASIIENVYDSFKCYLDNEHQNIIKEKGFSITDSDGDLVTPLFNNRECAFSMKDSEGITSCAIERAYLEGKIDFRKPISCHLYPIRISKYKTFEAVNYEQIDICECGRKCGAKAKTPLYKFLKEPLIRKYGKEWYSELEIAARELKKYRNLK